MAVPVPHLNTVYTISPSATVQPDTLPASWWPDPVTITGTTSAGRYSAVQTSDAGGNPKTWSGGIPVTGVSLVVSPGAGEQLIAATSADNWQHWTATFTPNVRGVVAIEIVPSVDRSGIPDPVDPIETTTTTVTVNGSPAQAYSGTLTVNVPAVTAISQPANGTALAVGDSGIDVIVTATTTDAAQVRGGLSVQVEWTDVVPGANPPIVARSAPLSAAGSTWSGTAHLGALPLGPRALTVRCQRAAAGEATAQGTATVTVTQSDAGAPHIVVNSPPAGETIALPASGSTSVTLQGTTMDTQSGMAGGQATTEWATMPGGPWAAVVPTAAGNFSSWTASIPITAAGTVVVYVRATDNAGNAAAAPLQWTANVVPAYTPSSVADRISEREYLQALLEFAVGQVTAGAAGGATSAQLTSLLGQPFTDISVPGAAADAASAAVNVLRVPIELLRGYLAAATVTVPESAELPARFTAYQSLLAALGTSFAELRLARAGTTAERAALAARLGVTLSASRPDELDQLCLDPQTLTEAQLGVMFGWPSTSSATPLVPAAPGLLQAWQLATQLQAWLSSDAGSTLFVVADPDVITAADVLGHTAQTTRITGLLTSRAGDLQGQHDVLAGTLTTQTGAHAADTAIFAALLDQGVPGFDLAGTSAADAAGDDVSATLAAAGLTRSGFSYLGQLDTLAGTGLVTDDEWTALIDVLVGAYRRRSYATWAAQETGLVVGPDYFVDSGVGTGLSTYRIEATARPDWVALVQARAAQRAALLQTNASALAAADAAALPVLRDALLAAAQQHIDPTGKVDAAGALTSRYQLDFAQSGALTTTRMSQAVASLQAVLLLVRSGDIAQVPDASTWTLTNSPAQFDDAWAWLGSIDSWQAAMVTYLFPEAALDPAQFGATPGAATASAAFTAFTSAIETLADLTPGDAATHVNSYATSNASWVPAAGASGVVYLSGRGAPHQATLAGWSASVAAAGGADAALEMFWAVPMLVAQRLQAAGHYQDALDWYWVVLPYNELSARAAYHEINTELAAAPQRPSVPFPATWTANLDPIAVARQRLTSAPFARATISQIAACLAAYADAEFTAETAGSLAHARDLYLTASGLLAHPVLVPLQPTEPGEGNFEIPQVDALRQRIASQLSKLRGGRNIAGLLRTSAGADGDNAGVPEPTPYHYKVLLTRAQQLTAQSAQVEALYLSLLEKLDAGTLKLQEAANAASIANLQLNVHADQVAAAIAGQAAAQAQVTKAQAMIDTYQANIDAPPNQYEQALLSNYSDMRNAADTLAGVDAAIGIAQAVSNFNLVDPATWVGVATGIVALGVKDGVQAWVNNIQSQEQANSLQSSIENRRQEWRIQLSSSTQDLAIAQAQTAVAADQTALALADQQVAQAQSDQAAQTFTTLQNQFTNPSLYRWMSDAVGSVYSYFLSQATAVARLSQQQLAFDRAEAPGSFIATDYWQPPGQLNSANSDTKGMTGAERLSADLAQLDAYAFSSDSRQLNLTQSFSLAQLMPADFFAFRQTGELSFATPMALFDADFPGHYRRRISQVRLSMVALVPPSRGIRATLFNVGVSRTVVQGEAGSFSTVTLRRDPCTVAVTSPQNAKGVFDLDPQPDLILPFEGLGVDTSWQLSLPRAANPFDYSTIADVIVTIDHTALIDYGYRARVIDALNASRARGGDVVCSLARDFPDAWYTVNNPAAGSARSAALTLDSSNFPLTIDPATLLSTNVSARLLGTGALSGVTVTVAFTSAQTGSTVQAQGQTDADGQLRGISLTALAGGAPTGTWTLTFDDTADAIFATGAVTDVLLAVTWSATGLAWSA